MCRVLIYEKDSRRTGLIVVSDWTWESMLLVEEEGKGEKRRDRKGF